MTIYWFGGGPGADPSYTPSGYTLTNAYLWGYEQGQDAVNDWLDLPGSLTNLAPEIFLDVEQVQGWDEWLTTNGSSTDDCSGNSQPSQCCSADEDRYVFDGFTDAVDASDANIKAVYSGYEFWNVTTFGCGTCSSGDGYIPNTR